MLFHRATISLLAHPVDTGSVWGSTLSSGVGSEKGSSSRPLGNGTPCSSDSAKLRVGRPRGPRIPRTPWIPRQLPRPLPWPRRDRGRTLFLVGSVVVLPASLLLSAATGFRPAGAGYRGRATAAVVLVLLSKRQSLLSDRSHVPRSVDQGPAAGTVGRSADPTLLAAAE